MSTRRKKSSVGSGAKAPVVTESAETTSQTAAAEPIEVANLQPGRSMPRWMEYGFFRGKADVTAVQIGLDRAATYDEGHRATA